MNDNDEAILEHSILNPISRKNYGAISPEYLAENLIYTWNNLNIFGTVNESGFMWQHLRRLKDVFCNERNIPAPRKHLLKNVSGIAYPGELLAVMGSSGAGKTTLLNALAFRSSQGVQISSTTVRMLNGYPVGAKEMQARCAYVQQDDLFIGSLTAREHLIFQAMVRMPRNLSSRQRLNRVDQVIQDLSLAKCQHTVIGVTGRVKGLSGGERKRLAFASEALTDPPLLICDEPTSGLDSFMAHSVVQVLKKLSQRGKTVLLTIHQPSSELFELFDKILLIADGRVAFLGTPNQAVDFFSYIGAQCPTNYNPADFYVQALAIIPGKEPESRDRIAKICDSFAKSKKVSTKLQLDKLTAYMEQNPDIARGKPNFGSSRAFISQKWEEFAIELNSCGPIRSGEEWKRVWINYKGNLKRKLSNNKKNFTATGGGPSTEVSLTAMEQSVAELINVDKQVNPSGKTCGLIIPSAKNGEETDCTDIENEAPQISKKRRTNVKKSIEEERLQQLKFQASTQEEILKTLENMENTLHKSFELQQKSYDLKLKEHEVLMKQKDADIELTQLKIKKLKQEMNLEN